MDMNYFLNKPAFLNDGGLLGGLGGGLLGAKQSSLSVKKNQLSILVLSGTMNRSRSVWFKSTQKLA